MLTITLSFIKYVGFGCGTDVSFAGDTLNPSRLPDKLYKIKSYYLDLGCISFLWTGFPKPTSEQEMRSMFRKD